MSYKKQNLRLLALGLTVIGAVARLIPHPTNFTPVGGMSVFAGARLRGWQAFLLPLVLMAVTDPLVASIYGVPAFGWITPFVYVSFLISVWLGRYLRNTNSVARIGGMTFLCSTQFFLVTNFAVWLHWPTYPHTAAGLVSCYIAALPFFGRTLAGDLFYVGVLFGLHAWLRRVAPSAEPAAARS
jgi:hypothetical protein